MLFQFLLRKNPLDHFDNETVRAMHQVRAIKINNFNPGIFPTQITNRINQQQCLQSMECNIKCVFCDWSFPRLGSTLYEETWSESARLKGWEHCGGAICLTVKLSYWKFWFQNFAECKPFCLFSNSFFSAWRSIYW